MSQKSNQVSDEELAFIEASVALDRAWDALKSLVCRYRSYDEIIAEVVHAHTLEQTKSSLYRCWKENHPNRYEDGGLRVVSGDVNDTTCDRCLDCGRKVMPRISETPGAEVPVIP